MQHWDRMSAKTGVQHKYSKTAMPACATRFYLNVLKPREGEVVIGRMREIEILSHVMDSMATNRIAEAADIVSQRMLACKMAGEDAGWGKAQYAELAPANSVNMVSRELRNMTQREEAAQKRLAKPVPSAEARNELHIPQGQDPSEPYIIRKGEKAFKMGWIPMKGGKGGKNQWDQGKNQGKGGKPDGNWKKKKNQ